MMCKSVGGLTERITFLHGRMALCFMVKHGGKKNPRKTLARLSSALN